MVRLFCWNNNFLISLFKLCMHCMLKVTGGINIFYAESHITDCCYCIPSFLYWNASIEKFKIPLPYQKDYGCSSF